MSFEDLFQLYDLRVEVVCPKGSKILYGAKEGDYFTLQGEMLYLPAGQGISIYSLCEFRSCFSGLGLILGSISTSITCGEATKNGKK